MRRAERLFQIIQMLRRSRRPVTAAQLAAELGTSVRSVYRDVAELGRQAVPIRGEAGTGYLLDKAYDMPPLMLTVDELEAAVLGAQWVAERGDPALATAARDLIAKLAAAVPPRLRIFLEEPSVSAPPLARMEAPKLDLARVRLWVRSGRKMQLGYRREDGLQTERVIWPVMLGYAETVRLLAAWCELRGEFRHFRLDRVVTAEFLEETHGCRPGELLRRWRRYMDATRGARLSRGETSSNG